MSKIRLKTRRKNRNNIQIKLQIYEEYTMKNHLTTDEILDYISLTECSQESLRKCAAVTEHIRECEKCLHLVQAFQEIYDAFEELGVDMDFRRFARNTEEYKRLNTERGTERDTDGIASQR